MSDEETLKAYAIKAQDYAKLVSRTTPDGDLQDFIDGVTKGGTVLDLGCGPGNSAAMMLGAGLVAEASDASPEMVEIASKIEGLPVVLARFDQLDAVDRYDGIWANFSLLHAPKVEMPAHLARIARALKSDGLLHLGLKTGTGEVRDTFGRLYAYYSEDELRGLLADAGLEVSFLRHGEMAGLAGPVEPYIIIKARLE